MSDLVASIELGSAEHEEPVYIPAGPEHVFGVVTWPTTFNGTAVLCMHAGAQNLSSHRGGVYTRLCRGLAQDGFLMLRIDFHGSGDSSGVLEKREIGGQVDEDVDAAIRWLLACGAQRVAVVGTCWGALVALSAAGRFPEVTSVCLVSPPMKFVEGDKVVATRDKHASTTNTLKQFLQPRVLLLLIKENKYRSWLLARARRRLPARVARVLGGAASRPTVATTGRAAKNPAKLLDPLVRRGVPVHILVGERGGTYRDLTTPGTMPAVDAAASILDIAASPVDVHGLSTVSAQDTLIQHVRTWLLADLAAVRGSDS